MSIARSTRSRLSLALLATACLLAAGGSGASSHREGPFVTTSPKVDASDFYMFRSYEANRSDYVTLIANYLPLQDAYGGPNYFKLDPNALYEIHLDNNGDAVFIYTPPSLRSRSASKAKDPRHAAKLVKQAEERCELC